MIRPHSIAVESLKRKHLLAIAVLILVLTALIYAAANLVANKPQPYEKSKIIARITQTTTEENALQVAEQIKYNDIFKIPRGTPSDQTDYSGEVVAQYIDTEVIEYFEGRFESLKGTPYGVNLNYTAKVSIWDGIKVSYIPPPENETKYSAKVRILSSNGTVLEEIRGGNARYAWRNVSGIQEGNESAGDFSFNNCYFVDMEFNYAEIYANLGAYLFTIIQSIVMDENLNPLLICLQEYGAVS